MEANEVANPVAVGFLGTRAVALHPHDGLHPVHQLRWLVVHIHLLAPFFMDMRTVLLVPAKRTSARILDR